MTSVVPINKQCRIEIARRCTVLEQSVCADTVGVCADTVDVNMASPILPRARFAENKGKYTNPYY
jgi:hypothetical protein